VADVVEKHHIVVLEGVAEYIDASRKETRTLHAVGDGTFVVDGRRIDRREMVRAKRTGRSRGRRVPLPPCRPARRGGS
jgi:hypothetical protein